MKTQIKTLTDSAIRNTKGDRW